MLSNFCIYHFSLSGAGGGEAAGFHSTPNDHHQPSDLWKDGHINALLGQDRKGHIGWWVPRHWCC